MGPTDTLKKGLEKLQDQIRVRKASLEATLKANKTISAADEEWATDYESALEGLSPQERSIVEKLIGIATGDGTRKVEWNRGLSVMRESTVLHKIRGCWTDPLSALVEEVIPYLLPFLPSVGAPHVDEKYHTFELVIQKFYHTQNRGLQLVRARTVAGSSGFPTWLYKTYANRISAEFTRGLSESGVIDENKCYYAMPARRTTRCEIPRKLVDSSSPSPTRRSLRLRGKMVGRASGSRGAPSIASSSEYLKLRATWTEPDVLALLDYVEENRFKAGDRMVFPEGHFNDLLPQLPIQPNGHRKTAKNCHDKWESLKREYYAASTIAGGSGLAYSAEKGANVVTEAGQLVMDELIEVRPGFLPGTIYNLTIH
ncbi:hypothetical protein EDD16DRAFT_1518025 [Pisolithus croceorrhizus]|nr:hypothetical protein EDD16DRAFT_1518025 [Pisolithus croceorrhizus]